MNRKVFLISGTDAEPFLQGLITNDIGKLDHGMVYAALLTPQGKFIVDFFLSRHGTDILLDVDAGFADNLVQRLTMYRLRADVTITPCDLQVERGIGSAPDNASNDPRHAALGWRRYVDAAKPNTIDWDTIRVAHCIPKTGIELTPDTFILEAGFERLNGVDFRKGCYVGQEITARMKHKTELRKGLARVNIDGTAPAGSAITTEGKPAGVLFTQSGGEAIAYLRFDRAKGAMQVGDATLTIATT